MLATYPQTPPHIHLQAGYHDKTTAALVQSSNSGSLIIHPSIFYIRLIQLWGRWGAGAYPSRHWEAGYTLDRSPSLIIKYKIVFQLFNDKVLPTHFPLKMQRCRRC